MLSTTRGKKNLAILVSCSVSLLLFFTTEPAHDKASDRFTRVVSKCRLQLSKRIFTFEDSEITNHMAFSYIINDKHVCGNTTLQVVMPVHSAVTNFRKRRRMRKMYQLQTAINSRRDVLMLFFVGLLSDDLFDSQLEIQTRLKNESSTYGDIIQVNVTDVYSNIIYKAVAVLDWISKYCVNAQFILKTDDDITMSLNHMVISLYNQTFFTPDFIIGELHSNITPAHGFIRKLHLSELDYPRHSPFPPFVSSPAMGYPLSTGLALYQQALRTKVLGLHDVFLTGICAYKLGIPVLNNIHFTFIHKNLQPRDYIIT